MTPNSNATQIPSRSALNQFGSHSFPLILLIGCLCVLALGGCAPKKKPQSPFATPVAPSGQRFNVEVFTDGKKVENHNVRLVHRMPVKQNTLEEVFGKDSEQPKLGFTSTIAKDQAGKVYGFLVKSDSSLRKLPKFGLTDGDVVTAVGDLRPTSIKDMAQLRSQLLAKGQTTLTFVRSGKHHKIFYYLQK
jgi:hypothetical protein